MKTADSEAIKVINGLHDAAMADARQGLIELGLLRLGDDLPEIARIVLATGVEAGIKATITDMQRRKAAT